ncbi:MAG: hypothetical protein AAGF45_11065 [Pseudomonadota bacterium]
MEPPAPQDPLLRDALEELVGLWVSPRVTGTSGSSVDDLVTAANTLLGRNQSAGANVAGTPGELQAIGDLIRPRALPVPDALGGLTPPVLPSVPASDIAGGIMPQTPLPGPASTTAWTAADLKNVTDSLDVPFADPELIAHIIALSPNAAVIVELRKAAYRLDKKTTRALLALLGALATLVRELADGPLKTLLSQIDAASLVAEIAGRHEPPDDGDRPRRRIDV